MGVVVGIAVAFLATRALGSLLFGVAALDVATFARHVGVDDRDRPARELSAGAAGVESRSDRVAAGRLGRFSDSRGADRTGVRGAGAEPERDELGYYWAHSSRPDEGHRSAPEMARGRRGRPRASGAARPSRAASDCARCMAGERAGHSLQATALVERGLPAADRRERRRVAGPRTFSRRRGPGHAAHSRRPCARAAGRQARRPRGESHLRRGARR